MSGESDNQEDKELESWLDELAGNSSGDDPVAGQLRETILRKHAKAESEVDELRLRRGRDKLLAEVRRQEPVTRKRETPRYLAIAASIVLTMTVGMFSYNLMQTSSELEILMAYGELERPRGAFPTLTITVADPESTGRVIGQVLTTENVPFELARDEDDTVRLAVFVNNEASTDELSSILEAYGRTISASGYYVIVIDSTE
jgi:hypothetical protein